MKQRRSGTPYAPFLLGWVCSKLKAASFRRNRLFPAEYGPYVSYLGACISMDIVELILRWSHILSAVVL
ncbi:MAG: hypothetical protein KDA60_22570, partial [Planctomycetales bacterium]|nr:hypothetical protein [Planctomycetales bacterium]